MMKITRSIVLFLLSIGLLTHCSSKKNKESNETTNPSVLNPAKNTTPPKTSSPKSEESSHIQVICSHEGKHDHLVNYTIDHDQEITELSNLVKETLKELNTISHPNEPDFAKKLKDFAPHLVYVINHDPNMNALESIWGYSAEDDPEYQYPDQTLYPQGTIKVNFTHSFMKDLIDYKTNEPKEYHDLYRTVLKSVVVHEITHA